ncbi:MAG: hypothetical protein HY435_03220 [Candidatus Liptonbacteria bacterium]|nr:hypothetical protein [Candidatus Liptonbacteria bacterium]
MMEDKMGMGMMEKGKVCGCTHHKIIPILIILFGLVFLLRTAGTLTDEFAGYAWPILVIAAGAMKLMGSKCKCC